MWETWCSFSQLPSKPGREENVARQRYGTIFAVEAKGKGVIALPADI